MGGELENLSAWLLDERDQMRPQLEETAISSKTSKGAAKSPKKNAVPNAPERQRALMRLHLILLQSEPIFWKQTVRTRVMLALTAPQPLALNAMISNSLNLLARPKSGDDAV
jgi:hypothetical protein